MWQSIALYLLFTFQQPQAFEVASVKPNTSGSVGLSIDAPPGGRFAATNATVRSLITFAYGLQGFQLSGGPAWLDNDKYDILAKAENSGATSAQIKQMVQTLLADRFQLKLRRETKEMSIYTLIVDKNGSKLVPTRAPQDSPRNGISMNRGRMTGQRVSLPVLAQVLSSRLGRIVIDRTQLEGEFDFTLTWTPDPNESAGLKDSVVVTPPDDNPQFPSLFTAIQEQLGLKVESSKGPVDHFVVDRVQKPTLNQ